MARVTGVQPNYSGIGEVLRSPEVRAALTARMERVLATAWANAPVDSGAYRDGLRIEQGMTDRVVVRVRGGSDHDFAVEADTGNLARALREAR